MPTRFQLRPHGQIVQMIKHYKNIVVTEQCVVKVKTKTCVFYCVKYIYIELRPETWYWVNVCAYLQNSLYLKSTHVLRIVDDVASFYYH